MNRRLFSLSAIACSVALLVFVGSGCSSPTPKIGPAGSAVPSTAQPVAAPSSESSSPEPQDTDPARADFDAQGKVDLVKFLTPAQTHEPKDADCEALFGPGAELERATSFAAKAVGPQYTLVSFRDMPHNVAFLPLSANMPGRCVFGVSEPDWTPQGEIWVGVTRAGGHGPSLPPNLLCPLFTKQSVTRDGLLITVQTTESAPVHPLDPGKYWPASPALVKSFTDHLVTSAVANISDSAG